MSGTLQTAGAGDPAAAAPVSTTTTVAPAAVTGSSSSSGDTLRMSEQTQGWIALVITTALCACLLAIVGVCCYRVAVDGNAPLTTDITHSLLSVAPWLAAALTAAAFGKQVGTALISKFSGS